MFCVDKIKYEHMAILSNLKSCQFAPKIVIFNLCICCQFEDLQIINPLSTRPHQDVVWYNNSWLGFLKILNYVPKEREKYTAKNEPSFVTVKCCDGS